MSSSQAFVTNLELRTSNPDGTEGAGLSHTSEGLFLLHVLELAAEGEPSGGVAIVHGAGDHGGRYQDLAELLAKKGWAVALPDLRGHGSSEGERGHSWGIPEPVRDIGAVLDHIAYRLPDAPKVLVGQGLGGLYALAFALAHPGSLGKLVLINPMLEPAPVSPPKAGGLKGLFKKPQPTDEGSWPFRCEALLADSAARQAFEADSKTHEMVTRHVCERLPGEAAAIRADVGNLSVPTLVVLGSNDVVASPAKTREVLGSKAEYLEVPGARHDLLHEQGWEQTAEQLVAWMSAD